MTAGLHRKARERAFHDALRTDSLWQRWSLEREDKIRTDPLWSNMKFYSIERRSRDKVLTWFREHTPGKRVLDYCCGNGDDALYIAQQGAKEVVGIDISVVSIQNCLHLAQKANLANAHFKVMDAESMTFPDSSFDILTEYGALHHLDLDIALREMARVLKPDGQAICVEALGHNVFIDYYRRQTPELRTAWEVDHILQRNQILGAGRYFQEVNILGFFHLASIAGVPFRRTSAFEVILGILEGLDSVILKMPFLQWWAWQIVFVLAKPYKNSHPAGRETGFVLRPASGF